MISLVAAAIGIIGGSGAPTADYAALCEAVQANYGCAMECGFAHVHAGKDHLCMPSGSPRMSHPFAKTTEDVTEHCDFVATKYGCSDVCGYKWDASVGECRQTPTTPKPVGNKPLSADPIIGGYGKFRYQYMPDLLKAPVGASLVNCHGWALDKDNNIFLTYQNDGKDKQCLVKWNPDGSGGEFMSAGGDALCSGTPHGLKITTENDTQYLYHANNDQKLTKTLLSGQIVWQVNGLFGQRTNQYRPTWFATPPNTEYAYLCDGYGSNNVYAFNRNTGVFMNKTWGGHSPSAGFDAPHGTFSTNHGCTYDSRLENTIIVSDRANHRLEFFHYNPASFDTFDYYQTVDFRQGTLGPTTLPCNIRMYPEQDGRAIVPDLNGPVAVLDNTNTVISIVNVSDLLAAEQHNHPHDAMLLPNGDMVVGTWNPGRVSYWKLLPTL